MPRNYHNTQKIEHEFGSLKEVAGNREHYERLSACELEDVAKAAAVILPADYRLVRTVEDKSGSFELALLCDSQSSIAYYIKAVVWDDVVLSARPVTQAKLWRTTDVIHKRVTTGITEYVFFNYLLKTHNLVVSDNHQTGEGRHFWEGQIGMALHFGKKVYRYDVLGSKLEEITDHAAVRDNSIDLWGDDERYEQILGVISETEIIPNTA